jgi:hypothetical protein
MKWILIFIIWIGLIGRNYAQVSVFPYSEDFDATSDATTSASPNGTGNPVNLAKSGGNTGKCAGIDFQTSSTAHSWFWVYFNAKGGYSYNLQFEEYRCTNITVYVTSTKTLAAASATSPIYSQNTYVNSWTLRNASTWSAPADGNYYLAFKVINGTVYTGRIDNITISEVQPIPLPIELIYFNATSVGYGIKVEWKTASENNVNKYIIKHSSDGVYWKSIDSLENIENSSNYKTYEREYYGPFSNGWNYFFLREIDWDGYVEDHYPASVLYFDQNKKLIKVTNLLGQTVDLNHKGIIILQFEDGKTEIKRNE